MQLQRAKDSRNSWQKQSVAEQHVNQQTLKSCSQTQRNIESLYKPVSYIHIRKLEYSDRNINTTNNPTSLQGNCLNLSEPGQHEACCCVAKHCKSSFVINAGRCHTHGQKSQVPWFALRPWPQRSHRGIRHCFLRLSLRPEWHTRTPKELPLSQVDVLSLMGVIALLNIPSIQEFREMYCQGNQEIWITKSLCCIYIYIIYRSIILWYMIIYVTIPAGVHYEGLRFCQPGKQTSKELLWTLVKYLQGPHQPAAHVTKIWAMSRPVTAPHGSLVGGHWWIWALGCFSLWWHGLWACCRRW